MSEGQAINKLASLCKDIAFWKGKCFNDSDLILKRNKSNMVSAYGEGSCTLAKVLIHEVSII